MQPQKKSTILGVDLIRRLGLCFDAASNLPHFSMPRSKVKAARLVKEVYLLHRSSTLCSINTENDDQKFLTVSIKGASQVFPSESLIQPIWKKTNVYLVNISEVAHKISRGTQIGELVPLQNEELVPWNQNEKLSVKQTTLLGSGSNINFKRHIPVLDQKRKNLIMKLANLQP